MTGFIIIIIIAALFFYYDRNKRSPGSHNNDWKHRDYKYIEDEFEDKFVRSLPDELMYLIDGPALYVDHNGHNGKERPKTFYSRVNNLGARPDYIFRLIDGRIALVELKTGKESEAAIQAAEIQACASALAVNQDKFNLPGIKVTDIILVFNNHIVKEIQLPSDEYELYRKIKPYLLQAWTVADGQQPEHYPELEKCRVCTVQRECPIYSEN